jgi:hypothetical protein
MDIQQVNSKYQGIMRDYKTRGTNLVVTNKRQKTAYRNHGRVLEVCNNHVVIQFKVFDFMGKSRGYQTVSISYVSIYCGDDTVTEVDDYYSIFDGSVVREAD